MTTKSARATWMETAATAAVVCAFAAWAVNWSLEGLVHSRRTQVVPDLKGRSIANALDLLSSLNLGLRKTGAEFDASAPIAAVLRQEPAAGTVVREGKTVRVVVSQGGQAVLTPSLAGLPLRNAEMLLRQSQLALGEVGEAYSLKMDKGLVLSQDPRSEAGVEKGTLVSLVLSGGPPPAGVTLMPDFQRKTVGAVQAWAAGAGMRVDVRVDASSPFPAGTVLTQSPAPDAALSPDAAILVTASGRPSAVQGAVRTFRYQLGPGGSDSQVRILLADRYGERELFNGLRGPGAKVEVPVESSGGGRVKIYVNDVLVEERDL
ncbi:MAG: PASTA domain-containing protein [Elusimicrobia bacterium]|nr:PASTA domain-containing protein [Elusimicrobiota bacterium]